LSRLQIPSAVPMTRQPRPCGIGWPTSRRRTGTNGIRPGLLLSPAKYCAARFGPETAARRKSQVLFEEPVNPGVPNASKATGQRRAGPKSTLAGCLNNRNKPSARSTGFFRCGWCRLGGPRPVLGPKCNQRRQRRPLRPNKILFAKGGSLRAARRLCLGSPGARCVFCLKTNGAKLAAAIGALHAGWAPAETSANVRFFAGLVGNRWRNPAETAASCAAFHDRFYPRPPGQFSLCLPYH